MSDRLGQVAAELAANRDLPLDLLGLCCELGVGFRVGAADGNRRGALMRRGSAWEVVLMRRDPYPAAVSPHERFTIAHELGHYMLMRETAFCRQRQADYWLGEDLCNHFASRLLIPDRLLTCLEEPKSSVELARVVSYIASSAGVTFEPAARAVTSRLATRVAIGTFRLDPWPSTRRLGFRGWWVENRPWWGARGGRRLAIYADHALAPILQRMRTMRPGETVAPDLAGALSTRLRRRPGTSASFAALLA